MQSNLNPNATPAFTYEDLFEFIQKNTLLREKIAAVDNNDPELIALYHAIKKGNADPVYDENNKVVPTLFYHPECEVYLLKLFKDGHIKPGEFLTSYSYLMALMELSDDRPLLAERANGEKNSGVKINQIKLQRLARDGELTEIGQEYIAKVAESFREMMNIVIDKEDLKKIILAFSPIEQSLTYIEGDFGDLKRYETLINLPNLVIPSATTKKGPEYTINGSYNFMTGHSIETRNHLYPAYPSYSLQQYFLEKYFEKPAMQITPRFGRINEETLWKMHCKNQHIYPLYSKYVKSNMLEAHQIVMGPFSIAKHDEAHSFLASILTPTYRKQALDLVPILNRIKIELEQSPESKQKYSRTYSLIKELHRIMYNQLSDLDVFPCPHYTFLENQKERYQNFIVKKCFGLSWLSPQYNKPGPLISGSDKEQLANDLIFHILKLHYSGANTELWPMIIAINPNLAEHPTVKLLHFLAKSEVENTPHTLKFPNEPIKINWQAWHDFLSKEKDVNKIVKWLSEEEVREKEVEQLITHCGLVFYPPYIPFTETKHEALLTFITANIQKLSKSNVGMFKTTTHTEVANDIPFSSKKNQL